MKKGSEGRGKIFARDSGFISGCSGVCTGPQFSKSPANALDRASDSEKAVDFALPALVKNPGVLDAPAGSLVPTLG